jgi:hypothetical protein
MSKVAIWLKLLLTRNIKDQSGHLTKIMLTRNLNKITVGYKFKSLKWPSELLLTRNSNDQSGHFTGTTVV